MELELLRLSSQADSTLGVLSEVSAGRRFLCFTLEDEHRTAKVMNETRIPAGRYALTLRREGGFHQRYAAQYPDLHRGMLWLRDVPGFEWVLIHTGNTDDDTAGCILVGDSAAQNLTEAGSIGASRAAYRRVYPGIAAALERGEAVWLTVVDHDTPPGLGTGTPAAPVPTRAPTAAATPAAPAPAPATVAVEADAGAPAQDPLRVARGQLTFDAEGTDTPGRYFSRRLHVPSASSGLTLGRGFDLRERDRASAQADLVACGIRPELAAKVAGGAGLRGEAARAYIAAQGLEAFEITHTQQRRLFESTYAEMLRDVERICAKRDVQERYGAADLDAVDPRIRDMLVDLRYRGDYTGATRVRVQPPAVTGDVPALRAVMADEDFWRRQRGVPADRFRRRRDYLT